MLKLLLGRGPTLRGASLSEVRRDPEALHRLLWRLSAFQTSSLHTRAGQQVQGFARRGILSAGQSFR